MNNITKFMIAICTALIAVVSSAQMINDNKTMEQNTKTTLIVTSTINPAEMESLQAYVQKVMPMLLELGGKVIKRTKITDVYFGEKPAELLLVMDFPSKEALQAMFDSEAYQAVIPLRNKGFSKVDILFAEELK
ncbi:MAG: DUF1330 domain-containing protein [Roseivirga sp.]|nr:DUF1330 domain-containing protein [Roseivirga sp.]